MVKRDKKEIAKVKLKKLFLQADEIFESDPNLANRYIHLGRKIAMKVNLRYPRGLKRKFCKHCYSYLRSGINCRIRTKNKKIVYYCLECKKYMRFPLGAKQHLSN